MNKSNYRLDRDKVQAWDPGFENWDEYLDRLETYIVRDAVGEPMDIQHMLRFMNGEFSPEECPRGPHRGPQGPNEDIAQCQGCGYPTFVMRPWGETFGDHLTDCSLPVWHESYCVGGGSGHPPARLVRG